MTSATEERVLQAVDMDALLHALQELIAIESVAPHESPAQQKVAEVMQAIGMEVDTWELDLDRLRDHPAYTEEVEREQGLGVIGKWGSGNRPTLILNGHVDAVPAGEATRWTYPPWKGTVEDNCVYGRGSADMKGGLCCALFAVKALVDACVTPPGTIVVQSVIGEEDGGLGTLAAVERGSVGDAAVVMEPTELMVAPAQAGALSFRIRVPGKAAHAAFRTEGVNPVDKFIPIYHALQDFEVRRNESVDDPLFADYDIPYALIIGKVRSGVWPSTVAETLVAEGRLGVAPGENLDAVRNDFEQVIHRAAQADAWLRDHPPSVEWWGAQFAPARTATDHRIVSTVREAYQSVSGQSAILRGMPYGSDMRFLANEGDTPSLLFGPGDIRVAHAPDEHVPLDQLRTATETLALTMLRFGRSEN